MSNKKKLIDLLQSKGLLFPSTSKEIEEFEKFSFSMDKKPADWDNPEDIINRGLQKIRNFKAIPNKSLNTEIEELRMVARKGNKLPQHIIDKMKTNHKNNDT